MEDAGGKPAPAGGERGVAGPECETEVTREAACLLLGLQEWLSHRPVLRQGRRRWIEMEQAEVQRILAQIDYCLNRWPS